MLKSSPMLCTPLFFPLAGRSKTAPAPSRPPLPLLRSWRFGCRVRVVANIYGRRASSVGGAGGTRGGRLEVSYAETNTAPLQRIFFQGNRGGVGRVVYCRHTVFSEEAPRTREQQSSSSRGTRCGPGPIMEAMRIRPNHRTGFPRDMALATN
jgi:hypothetical protein